MRDPRTIGILVERSRAFGRLLCEGIILYAQEQRWTIRYMTPDMLQARQTADLDGFIARVTTPEIARTLARTGKPVVDVFYNYPDFGFAIVKERHETLGRIAAEHFLDRKFVNFAYCPYGIGKTSSYCQAAFTHRLRRARHDCSVFTGASETAYEPDNRTIIGERLARPRDARALAKWLLRLPKPVGIFCPDDIRAWQVLDCCLANSIDVPRDIAILGLDNDILICGGTQPMLSSIDPNAREIGRVAAETLGLMMNGKKPGGRSSGRSSPLASSPAPRRRSIPSIRPGSRKRSSSSTVQSPMGSPHRTWSPTSVAPTRSSPGSSEQSLARLSSRSSPRPASTSRSNTSPTRR